MYLYRGVKRPYLENYRGMGQRIRAAAPQGGLEGLRPLSYQNGARWNLPGLPVLYFALTPSVAVLELANYFPTPDLVPPNYVLGEYAIPDSITYKTLLLKNLPLDWKDYPHPQSTKQIGSTWLEKKTELCLFVPSTASPGNLENIVVINPQHPEIDQIKLARVIPDLYNERIFKGL